MNIFRIILQMHILRNASRRNGRVNGGTVGGDDEANLTGGIRGDCGVGVSNRREYFFALIEDISDEVEVQPHALSLSAYHALGT